MSDISVVMGSKSDWPTVKETCDILEPEYRYVPVWFLSWAAVLSQGQSPTISHGVPIKGMLDGLDAMLSIIQMPPGIPTATVGVNAAQNAAILAAQIIGLSDSAVAAKVAAHKAGLGAKIEKANKDLAEVKYNFKTN